MSSIIINDSEYHNRHRHQQQQLNHPQQHHKFYIKIASFDWKFYIKYNTDLHGAGINNEILSTDHYNQYGTLFTIYIPAYSCLRIIVI